MEKKSITSEAFKVGKSGVSPKVYKVFIQKTYRNNEGYTFTEPSNAVIDDDIVDRSFILVYMFKKVGDQRNPMFIVKSVKGEDFKGRLRIIKHFEENHALSYAVKQDLGGKTFGELE